MANTQTNPAKQFLFKKGGAGGFVFAFKDPKHLSHSAGSSLSISMEREDAESLPAAAGQMGEATQHH